MSVRFNNMWGCIAIWLLLDLLMIQFGEGLPTWLSFDGRNAFKHDIWVVVFITWMWLAYREPSGETS